MDLAHVLWFGGVEGSGRSAVARALAERLDLQLYAVDEHEAAHAPRMPAIGLDAAEPASAAEQLDRFATASRHRFRLVLQDLAALPDAPPALVEGAQLFPASVAAVLREPDHALFLRTEQPATELDALLGRRFGWEASDLRLAVLDADVPQEELIERAVDHFRPVLERAAQRRSR